MIAVAVLFDLLPLLLIIGPIAAILMAAGDNPDCSIWEGPWDYSVCKAAGITTGLGGLAAVVALIVYSPMVYAFGSFLSVVLGLLLFGVWFMFKGVSPISLGLYMIFEAVPVVNILPMFTAGVSRCVRGAQREDGGGLDSMTPGKGDALSELNSKQNRTREENIRLVKARQIMQRGSIDVNETDPVLRAAYERARRGEKAYDGTYAHHKGFRFDNVRH
jgi:hypothetical protein